MTHTGRALGGAVEITDGRVTIRDEKVLASPAMDAVVNDAVFGDEATRVRARWLIWEIGQAVGVRPASIH